MIIINTKFYQFGETLLTLAKKVERYLPEAIIAIPTNEIENISNNTNLKVFTQQVKDLKELKDSKAKGTLLNHSEHRVSEEEIKRVVKTSSKEIVLCVETIEEAKHYLPLRPWAIAFEDKELIGSGRSITTAMPDTIKEFAELLKDTDTIPLCGAGISSADDVRAAAELGCEGVLVASAIAKDIEKGEKVLEAMSKLLNSHSEPS
jgi:triosephosphate isomerase (TIM)